MPRTFAVDATWDGGTGNWIQSVHWGFATGYPHNTSSNSYDVFIGGGTINGGGGRLDSLSFGSATINGSLISLVNSLTLGWSGASSGSILGADVTLLSTATGTLGNSAPFDLTFTSSRLTNNGTFTLAAGSITGGTLTNTGAMIFKSGSPIALSGGTLTNSGSVTIEDGSATSLSYERFINNGTLVIGNARDSLLSTTDLSNTGLLQVDSGSLTLGYNATHTGGSLTIGAGAQVTLMGGTGGPVSGAGNVIIPGGDITSSYDVQGLTTLSRGYATTVQIWNSVTMGSADIETNIYGDGTVTVNGHCTLAGSVDVAGGLLVKEALSIPTSFAASTTLTLAAGGTGTWGGRGSASSRSVLGQGASLINQGTFTFLGGSLAGGRFSAFASPPSLLVNTGMIVINAPESSVSISNNDYNGTPGFGGFYFQNQGLVKVCAGTLELDIPDSGSTTGNFFVAQGATLAFSAPYTFTGASTLTGGGLVQVAIQQPSVVFNNVAFQGTITGEAIFNGPASVAVFNSSLVRGSGTLTITTAADLTDATISIQKLNISGVATIQRYSYFPTFDGTHVVVNPGGTLSFSDALRFINDPVLTNNGLVLVPFRSASIAGVDNTHPEGTFTNNGTLDAHAFFQMSASMTFNNNGTLILRAGGAIASGGTDSPDAVIDVRPTGGLTFLLQANRPLLAGSLLVSGAITATPGANKTVTLGSALTFKLTGSTTVQSGTLLLAAPQDLATTGVFTVNAGAALDLAADYSFAQGTDPTLAGAGLVIVDPQITLVLAADTAFTGTIRVNGTLIVAPPRDPNAPASSLMRFTILPAAVPEPASVGLLSAGLLPLLRRRPPRAFSRHR